MSSATNRKPDRELLLTVVEALAVSKANLRRDPCGDWNITGRRGHASTNGVRSYVHLRLCSKRRWGAAKRGLTFLTVTQDGDDEGIFRMDYLPSADQATVLRKLLGLRRSTQLTDTQRDTLRRFSFARDKTPVSEASVAVSDAAAIYADFSGSTLGIQNERISARKERERRATAIKRKQ